MEIPATPLSFCRLLLLLAACYFTGAGLFARRGERTSCGLGIVSFAGGFCLVSFVFLLSKVIGYPIAFFALLPASIVALLALRKPGVRLNGDVQAAEAGWALAVTALSSLPVLIMGMRMGAGEYPAEFFAADSPFFLQQVYALISTDSYPPPSLETYGFSFKYHYGIQAFVALSSLLTGLKPHLLMFGVVEPLLELLTGLLIYDICRKLTGRHDAALACLLLVLFGAKQYLVNYLGPSGWDFVTGQENFNFRYPNPPNVAGLLISLCVVRCALEFDRTNMRLAALFFTCMLPVFKLPYLIPISAGLALVYCYELRKQFRAYLLLEIVGAAILSALCYVIFSLSPASTNGVAIFEFLGFLGMSMSWQNETLLILGILAIATAVATRHRLSDGMAKLLMFALAPYLLFSLWRLDVRSDIDNQYQIFELAIQLVAIFTAVYVVLAWFCNGRKTALKYVIAAACVAGLTGPGALSLANHIRIVAAHPERGHEYADNRSVADALAHIPVGNSLLVTNDLRYPADNYSRTYRQFQLAGIFGHRNFAANLVYGGFGSENRNRYASVARLFKVEAWPATQIRALRDSVAVTHLLIRKDYPHAADIPLDLVYENKDYAVYRF
jgi:hypothetical protein